MSSETRPGPLAAPNIESDGEASMAAYFDAFAPAPDWSELVPWPPDVFALANLVLDHTSAYRFVVAPPPGKRWPPIPNWGEQMRSSGRAWRQLELARGASAILLSTSVRATTLWTADGRRHTDVPRLALDAVHQLRG
jgi:hypothetical protein